MPRGSGLRRAVGLSAGLHLALAAGLLLLGRWQADRPEEVRPVGIDTTVDVAVRLVEPEPAAPAPVTTVPPEPAAEEQEDPEPTSAEPVAPAQRADAAPETPEPSGPVEPSGGLRPPLAEEKEPEVSRPPLAQTIPRPLPPELLALMRKPAPPAVVEVPVELPAVRGSVQQAVATAPARPAASSLDGGTPLHGSLGAGRAVVYVLDSSGSMGEFGKFDVARKALIATLKRQPEAVRFQVVVYAGTAGPALPAGSGGCVPATAQNVARMADVLLALPPPGGRSDHAEGLRAALLLRPDVVVFLSDADGPPPTAFRELVRRADPRPAVCVARVTAGGVGRPFDWK